MKFNCGETIGEYKKRIGEWHKWFAWHPCHIAAHDCRWLETVERKGTVHIHEGINVSWEYREIKK